MDEPTNHLDIESIVWLEAFLKSRPGALLMTSHDREFMNRVGDAGRRDRRRRDYRVFRKLRLLRARAGDSRDEPRGGVRAAAGDAGEGAALHRALLGSRREGGSGAEPRQGAREDREDRAAEEAARRALRLSPAAAVGRSGGRAGERLEGVWRSRRSRRFEHDHQARRALVRHGQKRSGEDHAPSNGGRRARAGLRERCVWGPA